jgi:hypothetical protein
MQVIREVLNCKPAKGRRLGTPLLLIVIIVFVSGGLAFSDQLTREESNPVTHSNRIAHDILSVDVGPILDSRAMAILRAALQDTANGIERRYEPYTANDDDGSDGFSDATMVVRWSQLAEDNAFAVDPAITDPFPNGRGWTMMYLAMHDALNAIEGKFLQYAFFGTDTSAHPIAAAAQAAHDVMNHIYPTRQAENNAELAFWLGQVPDGHSKTDGINLGMASAAAIINARANDNMLVFGEYALQDPLEPGDYRFVPPLEFVYRPVRRLDPVRRRLGRGLPARPTPAAHQLDLRHFGQRDEEVRTAQ